MSVRSAKTQTSLGIRPFWSESSLSAWRNLGSLATHWAHIKDSGLGGCPGWSESSLGAHSFCWFCHVVAYMYNARRQTYTTGTKLSMYLVLLAAFTSLYFQNNCAVKIFTTCMKGFITIWYTTWQSQQNECAPSEDTDQPGHSLSAWRNLGSLATHWAHIEDSDHTGRMPRLIWVFAGRTLILLVLSCRGSYV